MHIFVNVCIDSSQLFINVDDPTVHENPAYNVPLKKTPKVSHRANIIKKASNIVLF